MARIHSLILLPIVLLSFSYRSTTAQEHSFRTYYEEGVLIAETTGGPKYQEELFIYEQILTLQEDEREESLLYQPGGFLMDDGGFFYVVDNGNQRIAVFDPEGRYSHSFGRHGGGPGEFQYLQLQYVRNGIVSIYDFSFRRTTRFTTDGSLMDVTSVPPNVGDTFRSVTDADENKLVLISLEIPIEGELREYEWIHVTILDSLMKPAWQKDFEKVKARYLGVMKTGGRERSESFWYQYGARPMCIYNHERGIVYSSGWDPILEFYDLDGTHRQTIRLDLEPERVSRRERRYTESFLNRLIERNPGYIADMFKSELESMQYPAHKAYWSEIEIDDEGFIWLQLPMYRYHEIDRNAEGLFYRVIGPEGEYLGITQRTEGSSRASRGRLLVSRRNKETDEIIPTVYTISPAVEGLKYPN